MLTACGIAGGSMPPTASPVSKSEHGAEPHRPDRPEGVRNVNEDAVLKEVGKTSHV